MIDRNTALGKPDYKTSLADRIGSRARSRLFEMCKVVKNAAGRGLPIAQVLLMLPCCCRCFSPAALAAAAVPPAPEPAVRRSSCKLSSSLIIFIRGRSGERELVWLKAIGIRTVEFSIPWNWHQPEAGTYDFTGATSPRRDLVGFIRLLRRLEMRAWIRPLPPVKGWLNNGYPHGYPQGMVQARAAARAWLHELENLLAPQTEKHGGPIAFADSGAGMPMCPHRRSRLP